MLYDIYTFVSHFSLTMDNIELALCIVAVLVLLCWSGYFCLFGAKETFSLIENPVVATLNSAKNLVMRPLNYVKQTVVGSSEHLLTRSQQLASRDASKGY